MGSVQCKLSPRAMMLLLLLLSTISLAFSQIPPHTVLVKKDLTHYPEALCNDGTGATYHYQEDDPGTGKVLIYLQGGGGCFDVESCEHRCGAGDVPLCTADTHPRMNRAGGVFSPDAAENPPFHDFFKVNVHYCSSDLWTGRREASAETANLIFHGQAIIEAVVEDLMDSHLSKASQVVLTGTSAGGHGVGRNCDRVAEMIHARNPSADVRCLPDAPADFYPWWLHRPNCDPLQQFADQMTFWNSIGDESCNNEAPADSLECSSFATFYPHVKTPFMVIASEWDPAVAPMACGEGHPDMNQDTEFWQAWRLGMVQLAEKIIEERPESGFFLANCPYHVAETNTVVWGEMPVGTVESGGTQTELLKNLVKNWLVGTTPNKGLDDPATINSHCVPPHLNEN